jgi:hypothetical protein
MLLYAVASPPGVHGGGSRDGSERSLNSPESQWSIGILPLFFRTIMGETCRRIGEGRVGGRCAGALSTLVE